MAGEIMVSEAALPVQEKKSMLSKVWAGIRGGGVKRVESHALEAGHAVRSVGEGAVTGAVLGLVHAERGLDVDGTPIDGVVAGGAALAAIAYPTVGADMRNVAGAAAAVFAFRKTHDWRHEKKLADGSAKGGKIEKPGAGKVAGEIDLGDSTMGAEDPIIELAKSL